MNKELFVAIALGLLCFAQNLYAQVKPLPNNIEAKWGNVRKGASVMEDMNLYLLGSYEEYIYAYRVKTKMTMFTDKNLEKLSIEKYDKTTLTLVEATECDLVGDGEKLDIFIKAQLVTNKVIIIAASQKKGNQAIYGTLFSLESKKVETTKLLLKREFDNKMIHTNEITGSLQALFCTYENDFFLINYSTNLEGGSGTDKYYADMNVIRSRHTNQQLGFHLFDTQLNLVQEYTKPLNENFLTHNDLQITPEGTVLWFCKQYLNDKRGGLSKSIKEFVDNKPNYKFTLIEYKKDKAPAIYSIPALEGNKYVMNDFIKLNYINDTHFNVVGTYDVIDKDGKLSAKDVKLNEYGLFNLTIDKRTSNVVKKIFIPTKDILPPLYDKKRKDYLKGDVKFEPRIHKAWLQEDSSFIYVIQLEGELEISQMTDSRDGSMKFSTIHCGRDLVFCKLTKDGQLVWISKIEKLDGGSVPLLMVKDKTIYYLHNYIMSNFEKKADEELKESSNDYCVAIAEIDIVSGTTNKYILTPQTEKSSIQLSSPENISQTSPTSWVLKCADKKGYIFGILSIK